MARVRRNWELVALEPFLRRFATCKPAMKAVANWDRLSVPGIKATTIWPLRRKSRSYRACLPDRQMQNALMIALGQGVPARAAPGRVKSEKVCLGSPEL